MSENLHQNILHQLHVTNQQTVFIERENSHIRFVTLFVIDSPQLFPYCCLQERTFLKITKKRCWFYVRNTEFLPEVEVSCDIKIQAKENGSDNGDQTEC
jgi:hypothetical protein